MEAPASIAERVARASYGRLVAYLAARSRDVAAAEDALSDAFRRALETWPRDGVPRNPEGWLLTTARRRLLDEARRRLVRAGAEATLDLLAEEARAAEAGGLPDERLKLLFVCADPGIEAGARTALMLQTVLGLDAGRIASAFLVKPATMAQRLVRAKAHIRESGLAFAVPGADDLAPRLGAVLEAIYAAYGTAWDDLAAGGDLAAEALFLARLVQRLLPDEPEAAGLLALILHCEARRPARRADGRFVPLERQDTGLWVRPMIAEAEALLVAGARARRIGPFQIEAAIQSAHAARATGAPADPAALTRLYAGLVALAPSLGARVGHAAAVARNDGAGAALALLDAMPRAAIDVYQPYWVLRADLLARLGRPTEAATARTRALGLTQDPAVRAFLAEAGS